MRLTALVLVAAGVAFAERPPMQLELDRPCALAMGDEATGPDGLWLRFSGSGPRLDVRQGGREQAVLWARRPEGAPGPVARALVGDLFLTVEAMADESHVQLRVTRAQLLSLAWGAPLELPWCAFARDPDQRVWAVGRFDVSGKGAWVELGLWQRGESPSSRSLNTADGKVLRRDGELLLALEHDLKSPRGVRLTLRKPGSEVGTFTLGQPFSLVPEQSAAGGGLTVRLEGYGHKLDMERRDLPFVQVSVQLGGERQSLRFWRERDPAAEPQRWRGFELTMTACEDSGPPHSSTAKTTFVVTRAKGP